MDSEVPEGQAEPQYRSRGIRRYVWPAVLAVVVAAAGYFGYKWGIGEEDSNPYSSSKHERIITRQMKSNFSTPQETLETFCKALQQKDLELFAECHIETYEGTGPMGGMEARERIGSEEYQSESLKNLEEYKKIKPEFFKGDVAILRGKRPLCLFKVDGEWKIFAFLTERGTRQLVKKYMGSGRKISEFREPVRRPPNFTNSYSFNASEISVFRKLGEDPDEKED